MPQLVVKLETCHVELSQLLVRAADETDAEAACAAVQKLLHEIGMFLNIVLFLPNIHCKVRLNPTRFSLAAGILNKMRYNVHSAT